jgi:DNA invertase Pin-like site-specific DNA recombinase
MESAVRRGDQRPAFDKLIKDARRGKFDVIAAWSVDRLGRSAGYRAGLFDGPFKRERAQHFADALLVLKIAARRGDAGKEWL